MNKWLLFVALSMALGGGGAAFYFLNQDKGPVNDSSQSQPAFSWDSYKDSFTAELDYALAAQLPGFPAEPRRQLAECAASKLVALLNERKCTIEGEDASKAITTCVQMEEFMQLLQSCLMEITLPSMEPEVPMEPEAPTELEEAQ